MTLGPYGVSLKVLKRSADDTPHFFISKFIIEICAGAQFNATPFLVSKRMSRSGIFRQSGTSKDPMKFW